MTETEFSKFPEGDSECLFCDRCEKWRRIVAEKLEELYENASTKIDYEKIIEALLECLKP